MEQRLDRIESLSSRSPSGKRKSEADSSDSAQRRQRDLDDSTTSDAMQLDEMTNNADTLLAIENPVVAAADMNSTAKIAWGLMLSQRKVGYYYFSDIDFPKSLSKLVQDYVDFDIANLRDIDWSFKPGSSPEGNRKDKQRVKKTITFLFEHAVTADQKTFLKGAKPSTDSSEYQAWFTKLQHISSTVQSTSVKALHKLEQDLQEEHASSNNPNPFKAPSTAPKQQVTGFHSRLEKYYIAKSSKSD